MGFDNECILNIQSLPGEYFCPVCRTLIFPNEALQSQCTHLYCKPCLAYVVATTHACPYDGYLVTEADSKPLIESNKALAETIGKVQVYCLYHRSGCQWHGTLSDCINHCAGCSFGNSPVVCNRCGTQIVHRQVQEHAQTCPGLQPQGQQADNGQVQASTGQDATQDSSAVASSVTTAAPLTAAVTVSNASATSSVSASVTTPAAPPAATAVVQSQNQGLAVAYPQAGVQAPTAEQWYQQQQQLQYQQYYQQYPGYDPYQQQYQQYGQYQQQAYQQFTQPHMQVAPQQVNTGQQQTQPFMQAQPHVQTHPQPHAQPQVQPQAQGIQPQLQPQPVPQPLPQPQPQPQPQPHPQSQLHAHPQPQLQTQPLSHAQFPQAQHIPVQQAQQAVQPQVNPQPTQVSAHPGHPQFTQLQPYPQAQQSSQIHPQQYQPAVQPQQLSQPTIQHQQPLPQSQLRPMNPTQVHLYNQPQAQFQQPHMLQQPRPLPHPQPQALPLPQPQAQPQPQPQPQPQTQHPSVHGVTGHQSYPQPQAVQQIPPSAPQQRPMHPQQPGAPQQASQIQYPIPQLQQLRPPPTHMPMQAQQYPAMQPHAQAPFPNATLQPQALQLAHQPGQHMHHPPGMQPHPQQQALPQQQAQGHLPSSQLSQQGAFPTQPPPHSQQSLRPQVQSYMQPQLNVPPVQGRAVLPNQAITQQGQLSPAKPIQSGINQQAPLTRQHGSFQQSQLSHSGGQNSLAPAILPHSGADAAQISEAGSDLKSAVLEIPENSVLDKASQMQQLEVEVATGNADASEKSRSSDYVISKHDGDSKSLIDKKPPTDTVNEKSETKENKDDSVLNQVKGPAEDFHDGKERPHASTTVVDEVQRTEGNQNEKSVAIVDGIIAESSDGPNAAQLLPGKNKQVEMADQGNGTRGQSVGIAVSSMQVLQQMPHGQLPRDGSQLPPSQSGSVGLHGIPPAAPPNERFPPHNIPYGHPPSMADPSVVVSQRPSAPDRTFPQNIPQVGSSQERRYQESFPHQISVHGPATAPGQLRPHGYSENLGYPGQPPVMAEPFQPPGAKQPYSSNFPQKNIDEINTFPLQNQSYRPPPHVSGTGAGQIDPLSRPIISGPPPGAFDAPSGLIARGPNFGSEDQVGRSGPVNLMEGRGYYDGRMPEFHRPLSGEHPPYGQQVNSNMKMNGGKGPAGVMHDSAFSHGVPDDRFRPLPGERFKPLPEEGFRTQAEKFGPMTADPGRHIANRREFDEDFKHFPRPGHLDVDEAHRFSMYGSTGRPLDRGQQFGTDGGPRSYDRASLGSFPPYPPGGRFPPSSGVSEHGTLEIVDRQRGPPFNEDLTGKHEAVVHPERLRSFPEFGRPHFDSIPPIRSPGIPDASRRFLMEPGHLKKEIEAFDVSHTRLHAGDHAGHGLANNVRGGEPYGARNLPGHQRFGDSVGHAPLRGGEQIGFGVYGRKPVGDSGFSNSYPVHGSLSLDVDSFEHLRKRKHGSMGWCRICKIDCDTVEGLEVHSQTKDHQNMAMEIVLSIKKENAKKQKLTSEESEETNKSRKKSFENHGGRR